MSISAICLLLLAGCAPEGSLTPRVDVGPRNGFYVSPTGTMDGDGSRENPWDLARALAQPDTVQPGDTIWMLGGIYQGMYVSELTGIAQAPVVLRQFPGERATIDGRLDVDGAYAYYWDFEVMYSDESRITTQAGSDPTDVSRQVMGIAVNGPFNKLINLVVHDVGDGVFAGIDAQGLETYGSVFYNNGWQGPDRGHGHNIYLQNRDATKVVEDNVLFSSFSSGFHMYGTDDAYLWNFRIEGNSMFDSGSPVAGVFGRDLNLLHQGAGGKFGRAIYRRNSIYHIYGASDAFRFNTAGDPPGEDIQFVDNIVQGRAQFYEVRGYVVTGNTFTTASVPLSGQTVMVALRMPAGEAMSSNQWNRNRYATPAGGTQDPFYLVGSSAMTLAFPNWRTVTGYDGSSTFTSGVLTGADIVVRPNKYEEGRALITCWNWSGAASLPVDLTSVLDAGDEYEVHHVYDLFGAPVVTGVFSGAPVVLPQSGVPHPTPTGMPTTPPPTSPYFNVFIVRKR
jgi:hypothetical protein